MPSCQKSRRTQPEGRLSFAPAKCATHLRQRWGRANEASLRSPRRSAADNHPRSLYRRLRRERGSGDRQLRWARPCPRDLLETAGRIRGARDHPAFRADRSRRTARSAHGYLFQAQRAQGVATGLRGLRLARRRRLHAGKLDRRVRPDRSPARAYPAIYARAKGSPADLR